MLCCRSFFISMIALWLRNGAIRGEISIFDSRCRSSRIKNHHCLMLQHFNSEIDIVQIDCHSMLLDMLKLIETDGSASTQVQMDQSTGVEQTLGVGKADRNSITDLGKKRHRWLFTVYMVILHQIFSVFVYDLGILALFTCKQSI